MNRGVRFNGSYTVEAAMVMGIILTLLGGTMVLGYQQSSWMAGVFRMHELVEMESNADEIMSVSQAFNGVRISIIKGVDQISGKMVTSSSQMEIKKTLFQPTDWIRQMTASKQ